MPSLPLPTQVSEWAKAHLGAITPWPLPAGLSGARAWRVSAPQGLIDIRITRNHLDFRSEVHAHRTAIHHLGPTQGPRLTAFEPRIRTLLVTHPRGRPVDNETALHLLPRIHQDAGHLLAVLHDSVEQVPDARAQSARHLAQYTQRILYLLDRIGAWLSVEEAESVRRSAARLQQGGNELPVAFCHGTFGTGSWRWNIQSQTLSLSNVERAQVLPAICDFARSASLWAAHKHLAESFLTAYGRQLDDTEQLLLSDAALLASVEDVHHALVLRDGDALSAAGAALRDTVRRRSSTDRREWS
ncbi:hypothetical protein [Streptomyces sp. NPDC055099]